MSTSRSCFVPGAVSGATLAAAVRTAQVIRSAAVRDFTGKTGAYHSGRDPREINEPDDDRAVIFEESRDEHRVYGQPGAA